MPPVPTDQLAELRQRIHELELKLIAVAGREARQEIALSGLDARNKIVLSALDERHELWRKTFLDILTFMAVIASLLFAALAAKVRHGH